MMQYDRYGGLEDGRPLPEVSLIARLAQALHEMEPPSTRWFWMDAIGGVYHAACVSDSMRDTLELVSTWKETPPICERCHRTVDGER